MNKKLLAMAIAALMIIGLFPALTWTPQAHAQDECMDAPMCVFLHPGVADTFKPGWSHTLDTLWGTQDGAGLPPPGTPGDNAQTRQVFEYYLNYAILASSSADNPTSIGDLQFDITVTDTISAIEIYVPPEFSFLAPTKEESLWTDLTNDYAYVLFITPKATDPIAPGWTRIVIGVEEYWGDGPYPASQIGSVIDPGTYHIRLFDLGAPAVAGLYHFKIYYWTGAISTSLANPLHWNNYYSIGAGNFPIIVVKSELNPAWVEATVRTELMFALPYVSGQVVAEGTTPEGRAVKAQGFWGPNEFVQNLGLADQYGNPGAEYRTYLFGVAEGTYTLTAYASGAVPKTSERLTVLAGQSYHLYMTVYDSPDLFVTVWSKHGTGETVWHNLWQLPFGTNNPSADPCDDTSILCPRRDIMIELYDSDNKLVSFWASDEHSTRMLGVGPFVSSTYHRWFGWANRLGWVGTLDANGFPVFSIDGALQPTVTSYSLHLVDNYDVLYNPRGYPGTQWDGHVPWDTADYVSGVVNGAYTLEAYVTGYIMDGSDAYQRSFTVSGINQAVQLDLRRTNWIETVMHLPSGVTLNSDYTTVLLTADDSAGNERAAAAFRATPDMTYDGVLDGYDASSITNDGSYPGGIVIEGKNAAYQTGSSLGRGSGGAFADTEKDYGLNPTASTHSGGAVSLAGNAYTVKLWMADMGEPWAENPGTGWYNIVGGDPQVSIFLCNSPATLSFTIRPAYLDIILRSVDFEVPAHMRPWTFPGSEIWVEFKGEDGTTVDKLDPTLYGTVQDAGMICDLTGTGLTAGVSIAGPFSIVGNDVSCGVTPYDFDNHIDPSTGLPVDAGMHSLLKVRYAGSDWTSYWSWGSYALYRALYKGGLRPTHLPAGQYTMDIHTHGYVLRRSFAVQVPAEGGANIEADLIQGAALRLTASFKHEAVLTNFNGFVRVEVLNEAGDLVGASIYGQAEPNVFTQIGAEPAGGYFPLAGWNLEAMKIPGPAQAAGFGTPYTVFPSSSHGQRAMFSSLFYNVPQCANELDPATCQVWASWDYMTPIDANMFVDTNTVVLDVYGFYWYHGDPARTWAGGWPTTNGLSNSGKQVGGQGFAWDSGMRGSDDIPGWSGSGGGKYTIKVYAFDYSQMRMYAMGWPLTDISLPWGGAQDFFVDLNSLATLRGTVSWLDMFGNYRGLPWAQISASPGPGDNTMAYGTPGYVMWLPAGSHDVSVSTSEAPGVWGGIAQQNADFTVVVSDGWVGGGDTRLDHTEGVPVPELPAFAVPLSLFAALAASVWLLRKRTLNVPILTK